jgi:hypothetical protein
VVATNHMKKDQKPTNNNMNPMIQSLVSTHPRATFPRGKIARTRGMGFPLPDGLAFLGT